MNPQETIVRIATTFSRKLHDTLGADTMAAIVARNATPEYALSGSCATHDFIDANQVMLDAFAQVTGADARLSDFSGSEADFDAMGAAWDIAADSQFTL
jgi:hypothetical protein